MASIPADWYPVIRSGIESAPDESRRQQILATGIRAARSRAHRLFSLQSAQERIRAIRDSITRETNITATGRALDNNPFVGVTQDMVEQAYRAWYEGGWRGKEPWILLALWVKEGGTLPLPNDTISAASAAAARAIWRSKYYYGNLGLDHFTSTIATTGDNQLDNDSAHHNAAFNTRIADQVSAGRLSRDISGDINAGLSVTEVASGRYRIVPSAQFFVLSLLLTDAYYRENEAALAADPRFAVNGVVEPPLVYMRWNMGATRFDKFVKSAESHRREPSYRSVAGTYPSISQWAFHQPIIAGEYDQPRRNAVRFAYYARTYELAYEDF